MATRIYSGQLVHPCALVKEWTYPAPLVHFQWTDKAELRQVAGWVSLVVEVPEATTTWQMATRIYSGQLVHPCALVKEWTYPAPLVHSQWSDETELTNHY